MTEREPRWPEAAWVAVVVMVGLGLASPSFPDVMECGYLLGAYRAGHPGFLAGDFTFGLQHPKTIVFDFLLGPVSRVVSLEIIGWAGRIGLLAATALAMIRIARRAGLSAGAGAVAVIAWLGFGQSVVGGEIATAILVPRTASWAAGLWAVAAILARRPKLAGGLLGVAIAFHLSVGAGLSLAIAAAMVGLRYDYRQWAWVVGLSALIALPAAIPAIGEVTQPGTDLVAEWRFQALERLRVHLDLHYFSARSLAALGAMAGFVLVAWHRSSNEAIRALGWATIAMIALFGYGVLATSIGRYDLLAIYPFRVPPVLIQFAFLLTAVAGYRAGWYAPPARLTPLVVVAILLAMPNPIDLVANGRFRGRPEPADHTAALEWIRENTPPTATVVVSPVRRCTQFVSHRPQIVYGDLARLDRLKEWRERYQAHFGAHAAGLSKGELDAAFNRLDEAAIRGLVREYGGDFLVTQGLHSFPVVHQSGRYRVYDLAALERPVGR